MNIIRLISGAVFKGWLVWLRIHVTWKPNAGGVLTSQAKANRLESMLCHQHRFL